MGIHLDTILDGAGGKREAGTKLVTPRWCTCTTAQGFAYSDKWATYVHSACGKPTKPVYDGLQR